MSTHAPDEPRVVSSKYDGNRIEGYVQNIPVA